MVTRLSGASNVPPGSTPVVIDRLVVQYLAWPDTEDQRYHSSAVSLEHQRRGSAGMQSVSDEVAAVIIHERHQEQSPILAFQHESTELCLPQLIRLGAFESPDLIGVELGAPLFQDVTRFMQHSGDRRGARGQGFGKWHTFDFSRILRGTMRKYAGKSARLLRFLLKRAH